MLRHPPQCQPRRVKANVMLQRDTNSDTQLNICAQICNHHVCTSILVRTFTDIMPNPNLNPNHYPKLNLNPFLTLTHKTNLNPQTFDGLPQSEDWPICPSFPKMYSQGHNSSWSSQRQMYKYTYIPTHTHNSSHPFTPFLLFNLASLFFLPFLTLSCTLVQFLILW